jgi:hypothetical protein
VPPLHHLRKVTGEHTEKTQTMASPYLHGISLASLSPEVLRTVFRDCSKSLWYQNCIVGHQVCAGELVDVQ